MDRLEQQLRDYVAFEAVVYVQTGIVVWDFATTMGFDIDVIRGKISRTWPLIMYFGTRYGTLIACTALLCQINAWPGTSCQTVWIWVIIGVKLQKLFAEGLFALRASAVWDHSPLVIAAVVGGLIGNSAFGFATISAADWHWQPSTTPGLTVGSCVPARWAWTLGVAYAWTLLYDVFLVALICTRLWQMGQRTRSSATALIFRDGVFFLVLTMGPTVAALILYYAARTPPAQASAMTLSATLHSLCAARAARNLESFCARLPASWRTKVANGSMLDQETLARIAGHIGGSSYPALEIDDYGATIHKDLATPRGGDESSVMGFNELGHSSKSNTSRMAWLQEALTGFAPVQSTVQPSRECRGAYTPPRRCSTGGPVLSSVGGVRVEPPSFLPEKFNRRSTVPRSPRVISDFGTNRDAASAPGISIVTQQVETQEVLYDEGERSAAASAYSRETDDLSPKKF